MPSKKMKTQNGNSCAAHCTIVAVAELTNSNKNLDETYTESNLWPDIQFKPEGGAPATQLLAAAKNSDPRRIVAEVKKRWSGVTAKLVCDEVQKNKAISYVASGYQDGMLALFNMLTAGGVKAPVALEDFVFYNCSYTMHNGGVPSESNYSGMHNILVTMEGGKCYYYNSNEDDPQWKTTSNWKLLEKQNGGNHSYVFSGVSVALM
ncbi:MAG: hypothetical protein HPY82_05580 [Gammaproteobacteria bacterium]|nr:hypothetical protein [Gammaproteobacteria bacterium]